jgi:hypothetical protein
LTRAVDTNIRPATRVVVLSPLDPEPDPGEWHEEYLSRIAYYPPYISKPFSCSLLVLVYPASARLHVVRYGDCASRPHAAKPFESVSDLAQSPDGAGSPLDRVPERLGDLWEAHRFAPHPFRPYLSAAHIDDVPRGVCLWPDEDEGGSGAPAKLRAVRHGLGLPLTTDYDVRLVIVQRAIHDLSSAADMERIARSAPDALVVVWDVAANGVLATGGPSWPPSRVRQWCEALNRSVQEESTHLTTGRVVAAIHDLLGVEPVDLAEARSWEDPSRASLALAARRVGDPVRRGSSGLRTFPPDLRLPATEAALALHERWLHVTVVERADTLGQRFAPGGSPWTTDLLERSGRGPGERAHHLVVIGEPPEVWYTGGPSRGRRGEWVTAFRDYPDPGGTVDEVAARAIDRIARYDASPGEQLEARDRTMVVAALFGGGLVGLLALLALAAHARALARRRRAV